MTDRVMIDIETLGRSRGCILLSLGAVEFDSSGVTSEFYGDISVESCQNYGLDADMTTLLWWLDQDNRDQLVGGDGLSTVLEEFAYWMPDDAEVWANSPSFDCEILDAAFEAVGMTTPWEWYNQRDVRTIKNLNAAPSLQQTGIEHNALDDAIYQARLVIETLREIGEVDDE